MNPNPIPPSRTAKSPALTLQHEAFVANLAVGMTLEKAYRTAGFKGKSYDTVQVSARRMLKRPEVAAALEAVKAEQAYIRAEATRLAIEYSAITQARVATELGRIGFANMMDYMRLDPATGDPRLDFSQLTRAQAAALTEVTVDDYVDGRGENARDVRRVKFKLGDKRQALMDIAKLFGWIIERRENKIVDEFDQMSIEEIEKWLDERQALEPVVKRRKWEKGRTGNPSNDGSGSGIGGYLEKPRVRRKDGDDE